MNSRENTSALGLFLRSVARRMWQVNLIDAARRALWPCSLALLIVAVWHATMAPVDVRILALAPAAVLLAVMLRTRLRQPSRAEAAAKADRIFDAHAVFTTALECTPESPGTHVAAKAVVLAQANALASRVQAQVRGRIRPMQRATDSTALIPLFIAVLLLTQPGDGRDGESDPVRPATTRSLHDTDGTITNDDVVALRRELPPGDATGTLLQPATREALQPLRDAALTDYPDDRTATDMPAPPGSAELQGTGSGDDAGDAMPGGGRTRDAAVAQIARGESIAVEAGGGLRAASTASEQAYSNVDSPSSFPIDRIQPAAAPESVLIQTTLTQAQAEYAAQYLDATGDTDE